ncbi:hypothetical protein [Pseudomonas phage vB_PaeM_PAO1_Ab17]|uniref:Uncharacterized protein n=1 Tax=Pseudomonas phage vB_PaeM_PAO1_Ab17 TaxID=1548904 RepID=A0A0A1IUL0_9CAUD|nr:hypothetical protein [Pseudomonas phage vB_PaeM_PAO1_Ab17]
MKNIELNIGGKDFTFKVEVVRDDEHGAPWEEQDGHGPVSDWTCRDKRPGELVLNSDGARKRFYDFSEACRIALRDGWDSYPHNLFGEQSKRQQAAKAARADFENLRAWCQDEWYWVGVIVTLLDEEGNKTDIIDSLWGLSSNDEDGIAYEAGIIADDLARGYDVRWGEVVKIRMNSSKIA